MSIFTNWTDGLRYVWFDSLRPINNISVKQGRVFLGWTSTKLDKCVLLKDHNAVTPVRLELSVSSQALYHWATALSGRTQCL